MERVLSAEVIKDVLTQRFPSTCEFQYSSFITPEGKFIKLHFDHYDVYRWLVVEQFVQCIPDAESLLNELGYIQYSYVGYITLPFIEPTAAQYKTLPYCLKELRKYRSTVSIQVANNSRYYSIIDLSEDTQAIVDLIKTYYKEGELINV